MGDARGAAVAVALALGICGCCIIGIAVVYQVLEPLKTFGIWMPWISLTVSAEAVTSIAAASTG